MKGLLSASQHLNLEAWIKYKWTYTNLQLPISAGLAANTFVSSAVPAVRAVKVPEQSERSMGKAAWVLLHGLGLMGIQDKLDDI